MGFVYWGLRRNQSKQLREIINAEKQKDDRRRKQYSDNKEEDYGKETINNDDLVAGDIKNPWKDKDKENR